MRVTITLIVLTCSFLLASCKGKESQSMSDREQIQGTWQLLSGERNGMPISEDAAKQIRLVFEGCRLLTKSKDRVTEAGFRLNADVTPTQIDLEMDGQVGGNLLT